MDAGRIIADGDPRAVMADPAVISAYLGGSVALSLLAVDRARRPPRPACRRCAASASEVERGETIALVGANGAGKTTLLRAIAGRASAGGRPGVVQRRRGHAACRRIGASARGIALVPEGRRLFAQMSVEENLLLARAAGRPGAWTIDAVMEAFPNLKARRKARAGTLSGGEQQATAIGRALMTNP